MARLFLFISAALHLGLLWVLLPPRDRRPEPRLHYVEVAPAPSATSHARAAGKSAGKMRRGRLPRGTPRLSLSDLGVHWTRGLPDGSAAQSPTQAPLAYGSGGGTLLDQIGGTVTYQRLHDRIDQALVYPVELVAAGFEGTVSATLLFSDEGVWLKDRSRVRATSPYLRVHVLRTLREALATPLPKTYIPRGYQLKLVCLFHFQIARRENPLDASPDALKGVVSRTGVLGNHLYFYRADHLIGVWKLGPIHGYGIVPSVAIDPQEVVDDVAEIFSHKAPIDPLEKYRRDPDWAD